jgi:hypothetical protein
MDFLEAMDIYFSGEKNTGLFLIPLGLCLVGFGVYMWRSYGGGFGAGMGIPLLIVGLGAAVAGGVLRGQVDNRGAELRELHSTDKTAPVVKELERMEKVNANWPLLKAAWTGLIVVCLGLIWLVKKDWVTGLALAFLLVCSVIFIVDMVAEKRAELYVERIQPLAESP